MTYLELARKANIADAIFMLAQINENEESVCADDLEIADLYFEAAKLGHSGAQDKIGRMFFEGTKIQQDYAEAMRWCMKAAEKGYVQSQYYVGEMYRHGWGVVCDYNEARKWLGAAAKQNHKFASIYYNELIKSNNHN